MKKKKKIFKQIIFISLYSFSIESKSHIKKCYYKRINKEIFFKKILARSD